MIPACNYQGRIILVMLNFFQALSLLYKQDVFCYAVSRRRYFLPFDKLYYFGVSVKKSCIKGFLKSGRMSNVDLYFLPYQYTNKCSVQNNINTYITHVDCRFCPFLQKFRFELTSDTFVLYALKLYWLLINK